MQFFNDIEPKDIDDYINNKEKMFKLQMTQMFLIYERIKYLSEDVEELKKIVINNDNKCTDIKENLLQLKVDHLELKNKLIDVIEIVKSK